MNIIITLFATVQLTLTPAELYNEGNRHYEAGNYYDAIDAYEEAIKQVTNAQLFYNIGNSYFKVSKIGKAILNYRRARSLRPRDVDINHNLMFARNYRVDKIQIAQSPIANILSRIFHYLSLYEAQFLCTILFLLNAISVSLYVIKRRNLFGYIAIIGVLFCVIFFVNWQIWIHELTSHHAVIIAPEVKALSGPGEDYKEILVIHDGSEVFIREERGDYTLIQLPGGMGGWITREALEEIY